jgi:DNA-binding response OmpR family regulator
MTNILICDDEPDIVTALQIYLKAEGYSTYTAHNGRDALKCLAETEIHLILLDIMMPEMDGITALARLREKYNLPVIFLTAKSEDTDKVLGLNIGADDYVTKPFNPVEVLARVKSQLRRYLLLGSKPASAEAPSSYRVGGLELDDKSKLVQLDGEPVNLTLTEFEILKLLMQRAGEVLSPREIYRHVWHEEPLGAESTVAVHVRHLREKIEINPAEPRLLKVVWAQGYKIDGGYQK